MWAAVISSEGTGWEASRARKDKVCGWEEARRSSCRRVARARGELFAIVAELLQLRPLTLTLTRPIAAKMSVEKDPFYLRSVPGSLLLLAQNLTLTLHGLREQVLVRAPP